jgi:hypothetical protein
MQLPADFALPSPPHGYPATITFFYLTRLPGRGDVGVDWTVTGPKTTHAPYWPRVAACLRKDTWAWVNKS